VQAPYYSSQHSGDKSSHHEKRYSADRGADKMRQSAALNFHKLTFLIYDYGAPETNDVLDAGVCAKDFLLIVDWNWLYRKIEIR
jgi:hypothetical protein